MVAPSATRRDMLLPQCHINNTFTKLIRSFIANNVRVNFNELNDNIFWLTHQRISSWRRCPVNENKGVHNGEVFTCLTKLVDLHPELVKGSVFITNCIISIKGMIT